MQARWPRVSSLRQFLAHINVLSHLRTSKGLLRQLGPGQLIKLGLQLRQQHHWRAYHSRVALLLPCQEAGTSIQQPCIPEHICETPLTILRTPLAILSRFRPSTQHPSLSVNWVIRLNHWQSEWHPCCLPLWWFTSIISECCPNHWPPPSHLSQTIWCII